MREPRHQGHLVIWDNRAPQHTQPGVLTFQPDLHRSGAPRTLQKMLVPSPVIGGRQP